MSALITVLVPARHDAPYLAQALGSLRAQGFARWQAVVIALDDDAFRNATSHAQADPRLRVVRANTDEVRALAREGNAVETDFLCVLDGDDALAPNALASLFDTLLKAPAAGMAYSRHVLIDPQGRTLGPGPLCELPYSPEALLLDCMTGPLRLMRSQAYRDAGGHAAGSGDAAEYDLCLRLSETSVITHLAQPLYARRIHAQAAEVARWAEGITSRYDAFVRAVKRRGLDAQYDCALEIDSWHILQPLQPFGGIGILRQP